MSHDILARLEAVAARLEGYASAVASGAVSSSSSSSGASDSVPREVEDYDAFYQDAVVPFLDAAKKSKDTEEIAPIAEQSFQFVRRAILASKQCKKPSDKELSDFIAPLGQVVGASQKCSRKVPGNHAKAVPEAIQSVSWIAQGGNARQFCQDQLEAADFWLIKIMKEGKDSNKAEFTEFAQKLKQLLTKQIEFVGDNFRGGLQWNTKGVALSSFKDSGSAFAHGHGHGDAGAPPPPGPPGDYSSPDAPGPPPPMGDYSSSAPAKKSGGTAGMGAVFDELCKKGDGVTAGLNRVTKDMKAALKAAPVLEVKKKETCAPAKKWGAGETKAAEKKEPKLYLAKGTWFVEHYENETVTIDAEKLDIKENVYIMKCKNTTVIVPNKCKSIQVDGCVRTSVQFPSVVSLAEIFNSQRCNLLVEKTVPSVAIDKSAGCQIHLLSPEGVATPPDIITSSVSELNLVIPGKTPEDDPIEIPLPEQYITKYKGGMTLVTEPVTHGSNG